MKIDKERWRWVVGWKGYYLVSSHGRVKSVERIIQIREGVYGRRKAKYLKPIKLKYGHLTVNLNKDGKMKHRYAHQLVMEAFVGPCPPGMEVRHFPDRDPTNNRLDNLQYGTRQENMEDRTIHGTDNRGERSGRAKLTEEKVRQIRQLCAEKKYLQTEIAKMFEVSVRTISNIHRRVNWEDLKS